MAKMRTTTRGGRQGNAKHNDRTYLSEDERPRENRYGYVGHSEAPNLTFREAELRYYEKRYSKGLEARNERYKRQGHKERCKTIEDLYKNDKTCPTETIFQIGDVDKCADPETLKKCYFEYMKVIQDWNSKHGCHFHILDYAMHFDEKTPHVHERAIMDVTDRYGNIIIAQEKALREAGIELPDPSKPEGRYNNRKITFDKMRREMFQEICLKHGLKIEVEPRPQRQKHKSVHEYKREQSEKEVAVLKKFKQQGLIR